MMYEMHCVLVYFRACLAVLFELENANDLLGTHLDRSGYLIHA